MQLTKVLSSLYTSDLFIFLVLFFISFLVYLRYFKRISITVASGSVVMAIGIFASVALPEFYPQQIVMLIVAMEVLVIWLYLANGVLQLYFSGELSLTHFSDRMAIGTWVAGTAITALLLDQVEHTLHGYIVLLGIIAVILWFVYMAIVLQWLVTCFRKKFHVQADGMILLATVSTQSIVLLFYELFNEAIPVWIYQTMIMLGFGFYLIGVLIILHYFLYARRQHVISSWPSTNSINHGAMAITGVAMISSHVFPEWVDVEVWWWTAFVFIVVELIELFHLAVRIKLKGIVKALFVYDTRQWSRIFTFGMFYAFTLMFYTHDHAKNLFVYGVAHYGHYVVAALLIFEIILAFNQERR